MEATTLWKQFNLAPGEPEAILAAQDGLCAICKRPLEIGKPSTCTDHNHLDGRIQGLLCFLCNRGLGLLGDDIERLKAAIAYLLNPPAERAIGVRFGHIGRVTRKHGTSPNRRGDFYRRGEVACGGVLYRCGCRDCRPRPKKICPVHGQPTLPLV